MSNRQRRLGFRLKERQRRLFLSSREALLPGDWKEPPSLTQHLQDQCLPRPRKDTPNDDGPLAA